MSCAPEGDGPLAPGQGSTAADPIVYEIDFASEPDVDLTSGPHTIGGLPWISQQAAGDVWEIQNGTGLVFAAGSLATGFLASQQTASYLYIPLVDPASPASGNSLYDVLGFDFLSPFIVEVYVSQATMVGNVGLVALGIWGIAGTPNTTSTRMRLASYGTAVGTRVFRATYDSAASNLTTPPADIIDVIGFRAGPGNSFQAHGGNAVDAAGLPAPFTSWDSWRFGVGAPGVRREVALGLSAPNTTAALTAGSLVGQGGRLALAMPSGSAAGTFAATVERMRIVAVPPVTGL